jgi:uncharacterized protein
MSLLVQSSPLRASTVAPSSEGYTQQLTMSGAAGALIFTTVTASTALSVSASGLITTTGLLLPGSYTVSGTVVDISANFGSWVFTLVVSNAASPQVSVTPVQPAPPSNLEIALPFHIDSATGAVAVVTDYAQILAQHIAVIVLTAPGERVMQPDFGYGLVNNVFSTPNELALSTIESDIQTAIETWESAVTVQSVVVTPSELGQMTVTIQFMINQTGGVSTVSVSTGGQVAAAGTS